jgi:putative flippase GtrA
MLSSSPVRYVLVGGLAFLIDIGLLWLLHEGLRVPLAISTPVAFLLSFAITFFLQRALTFRTSAGVVGSAVKYTLLVAFNTVATTLIVTGGASLGLPWEWAKVIAVASTTVWNYFGYRYWIFPHSRASTRDTRDDADRVGSADL